MKIIKIFCQVHDFWKEFQGEWEKNLLTTKRRNKTSRLCMSEVMTIVILFYFSRYRTFKDYYQKQVMKRYRYYFPHLVSYNRFVELMQACTVPLALFMRRQRLAQTNGVAFIDSTALAVCQNTRILQHRVFYSKAQRGKTSTGWFFGYKLHLVINHQGEIISFCLTPGNTDDRKPVEHLTKGLWGKLFGDKGYLSQNLQEKLKHKGVELITRLRSNIKPPVLSAFEKLMLRKRALIESVNDFLKNTCQIQHTRHRSKQNWLVNLLSGLAAYSFLPKKPTLKFSSNFVKLWAD
ncbi:IS982 family transposase [Adhaeribacter radiodurans]|uniref:IS982 family transposase n=1 Tax=Adhaeribacter radiodurans TaxID=2745197 RepID=A0A7L7LCM5_9BACT|nr:IS982 family transposase [Adhaeribacter radiodurans]QMU30571.1 IS982 family transposase [Adhaeribacter radiodurans]